MEGRTMVQIFDEDGDMYARILLTEEQVRLYKWLVENACLVDDLTFQIWEDKMAPIEI